MNFIRERECGGIDHTAGSPGLRAFGAYLSKRPEHVNGEWPEAQFTSARRDTVDLVKVQARWC
ncbi:MAG TPA: hypothetical protein VNX29_01760 [Kaistia sp.]|nr:hypothetical protein [Kaistia sp.]